MKESPRTYPHPGHGVSFENLDQSKYAFLQGSDLNFSEFFAEKSQIIFYEINCVLVWRALLDRSLSFVR